MSESPALAGPFRSHDPHPPLGTDPDRFFGFTAPGSQEWWYFDAVSQDGQDVLVVILYAALPFDPAYGVGTLRHLANPAKYPAPLPLDHCAVGISWYREGKTLAYALNAFRSKDFVHQADPFSVCVAGNVVERRDDGYHLHIETPAVDGRRAIEAELWFQPAASTRPFEINLGDEARPHHWILAAADCQVHGKVSLRGRTSRSLDFQGRGYHDHNAGIEDLTIAMKRWRWGRVHAGPWTTVYYHAEPHDAREQSVLIHCLHGEPVEVLAHEEFHFDHHDWARSTFGIVHERELLLRAKCAEATPCVARRHRHLVDAGPFYLRWVSDFDVQRDGRHWSARGICEHLETRNLHRPLFNWMIPYRLKRPTPRHLA